MGARWQTFQPMRDELFPMAANLSLPIPLKMYVLNTFLLNPQSRQHHENKKTNETLRLQCLWTER